VERRALCVVGAVVLGAGFAGGAQLTATSEGPAPDLPGVHGKAGADHVPPQAFDAEELRRRLAARGMTIGNPIMIRIFKQESELEVWMNAGTRFELFATYPICNWSGTLGPKLAEGDKQSPEGLYSIGPRQLRRTGRWRRSLDIGFPNSFDRALGRTGSYVLVHGGCTSTGCYAMTDPVMEEIFKLSEAALAQGQKRIQVHAFPFRMTPEKLAANGDSEWNGFWSNLKEAYDLFERTRVPPAVSVCNNRYAVGEKPRSEDGTCATRLSAASDGSTRQKSARRLRQPHPARDVRRFAHTQRAHRAAGRNTRQAYAAARVARMAARQRHAAHGAARHRTHR